MCASVPVCVLDREVEGVCGGTYAAIICMLVLAKHWSLRNVCLSIHVMKSDLLVGSGLECQ